MYFQKLIYTTRFFHVILFALWKYLFGLLHITGSLYNIHDLALVHKAAQKNRIPQHVSDEHSGTSAGTMWKIIPPLIFNPCTHTGVVFFISHVAFTSYAFSSLKAWRVLRSLAHYYAPRSRTAVWFMSEIGPPAETAGHESVPLKAIDL